MTAVLQAASLSRFSSQLRIKRLRPSSAALWVLREDGIVPDARVSPATDMLLVPTEHVLLLSVHLPLSSQRQRMAALPFAIEDRLAESLEAVHVALGVEIGARHYLAGIVRHRLMADWIERLEAAGLSRAALVPDVLLLPQPGPGHWAVDVAGSRALVRCNDGTGFAVDVRQLPTAWRAAGQPRCISYGEPLPETMAGKAEATAALPLTASPALDLRQGPYARAGMGAGLLKRAALVAVAGTVAHGAIAAADTLALQRVAGQRTEELRQLVTSVAPGRPIGDDVASAAADLLPVTQGGPPSRFLPLLSRTAEALGPSHGLAVRHLRFDRSGALLLELEAPDSGTLQRMEQKLRAAGLSPARRIEPDGREQIIVHDPAGGRS